MVTKRSAAILASGALALVVVRGLRRKPQPSRFHGGPKKRIIFDASGWFMAYYMGVFEYVFETYGRDNFKDVVFAGISGGGQAAGYAIASVHHGKSMRYWLNHGPKMTVRCNLYSFSRITFGMYLAGVTYYERCQQIHREIHDKYFSIGTTIWGQQVTCESIENANEFGRAVATTGNVPFIGSFLPWRFRSYLLWDGMLSHLCSISKRRHDVVPFYSSTDKTLIVTLMSQKRFVANENVIVWNVRKHCPTLPYSTFSSMRPCFMNQRDANKVLETNFVAGYEAAAADKELVGEIINAFLK